MKPLHVICVLLLLGLSLPCMLLARTSSTLKSNAEPAVAMSCGDRYNSLLKSAKAALIRGDRTASVDALFRQRGCLRVAQL